MSYKYKGMARPAGHDRPAKRASHVEKYARIPRSVLFAAGVLTAEQRCVYGALADQVWQGRTAALGERLMAKKLGFSRSTVQEALRVLQTKGFIQRSEKRINRRWCYELVSPVFGQKQGRVDEVFGGRLVSQEESVA